MEEEHSKKLCRLKAPVYLYGEFSSKYRIGAWLIGQKGSDHRGDRACANLQARDGDWPNETSARAVLEVSYVFGIEVDRHDGAVLVQSQYFVKLP